ncbi:MULTISPECIES: ROK family transcriptional regulator [unclassified Streptomyces]|uniref:ROK family transcriptional regulator n=1 Tax=unclassified Streptomyces TaxID=2593676 RepID=UPI00278C6CC4|nr:MULTISPECIES: ROK family transcriptional regulator [unclassified Streptomyces]
MAATVGANLSALRGHNAALVLDLLRTAGETGISRLELAERTGLTPQAVSKITARLRGDGLAVEAGRRASTGGKPRTVLRLLAGAGHAVGLHLDRDELRIVLADLSGAVVAARRAPLDLGAGSDAVLAAAACEVDALLDADGGQSVLGVGVAVPGPLDHMGGVLHRVTGFPQWDGFPLRDALAERLGLPVVVDKDTNAAALALALEGEGEGAGEGAGEQSFAYLHLGTGLGAGLVLDGALYRGARTGAGEFGHQVIQLDGPVCGCGNRGCIEALCLAAVASGTDEGLDEAARVLGEGAANLVSLLDIDAVLLGGRTVAAHEDRFVRGVAHVVAARARREGGGPAIPVRAAPGGDTLAVEGAAHMILAPVFGHATPHRS